MKPATTQQLTAHYTMRVLEAAGLPPGVINMVTGSGKASVRSLCATPDLAGIPFTGSTAPFGALWDSVTGNLRSYRVYPRLVGETGGKDTILAHPSADIDVLRTAVVRGAFEYQGQKCSAASRAYIPPVVVEEDARRPGQRSGRGPDGRRYGLPQLHGCGYRPQIVRQAQRGHRPGRVYDDADYDTTLRESAAVGPYGLTGAIIAQDRAVIVEAMDVLRFAAGNFYVNDKPTGAVVGQQPFGGACGGGPMTRPARY